MTVQAGAVDFGFCFLTFCKSSCHVVIASLIACNGKSQNVGIAERVFLRFNFSFGTFDPG
jgi:hypothetical protein